MSLEGLVGVTRNAGGVGLGTLNDLGGLGVGRIKCLFGFVARFCGGKFDAVNGLLSAEFGCAADAFGLLGALRDVGLGGADLALYLGFDFDDSLVFL